jgi:hypothetical protein
MYSDASNALPERCDLKLQFTLLPVCPIQQTVAWQLSNNGYRASSPSDVVSRISAFGRRPSNAFDVVGDDEHKKSPPKIAKILYIVERVVIIDLVEKLEEI